MYLFIFARQAYFWRTHTHTHALILTVVLLFAQKMYLVMELCQGGELNALLKKQGNFKEQVGKISQLRNTRTTNSFPVTHEHCCQLYILRGRSRNKKCSMN